MQTPEDSVAVSTQASDGQLHVAVAAFQSFCNAVGQRAEQAGLTEELLERFLATAYP